MRQVRLGQTNLQVSVIAFGTWAFGGDWGDADLQESKDTIHHALELGINLFDTAQGYGFGAAEQLLAEALRERTSREEVIIATKGGLRMDGDRLLRDASRRWLREGLESSLRNLGTDYIDLYQVHWPDLHAPPEETAAALEELVGEGRSATLVCPTTTPTRCKRSAMSGGWKRCSRRITCSAGKSRQRSCPIPPSTTSACWFTGRWPMVCSRVG